MEDAIGNYRKEAEKTFNFMKPNKQFRNDGDESIGI